MRRHIDIFDVATLRFICRFHADCPIRQLLLLSFAKVRQYARRPPAVAERATPHAFTPPSRLPPAARHRLAYQYRYCRHAIANTVTKPAHHHAHYLLRRPVIISFATASRGTPRPGHVIFRHRASSNVINMSTTGLLPACHQIWSFIEVSHNAGIIAALISSMGSRFGWLGSFVTFTAGVLPILQLGITAPAKQYSRQWALI